MSEKLHIFFRPEMLYLMPEEGMYHNFFYKPKLFLSKIVKVGLNDHFAVNKKWEPFSSHDFYKAHSKSYVDSFFQGKEFACSSNGIPWSHQFTTAVRYMNASLYYAILYAIKRPARVTICPTGGFTHAMPDRGSTFCTFSGHVLAALMLNESLNKKGAFIELGATNGVSIPESRKFFFDNQVDRAIPPQAHVSPEGEHEDYVKSLEKGMEEIYNLAKEEKIDYIVYSHGADSHMDDDTANICTAEEWRECSEIVFQTVKKLRTEIEGGMPFTMVLDGGFRSQKFSQAVNLHLSDAVHCLNTLYDSNIQSGEIVE